MKAEEGRVGMTVLVTDKIGIPEELGNRFQIRSLRNKNAYGYWSIRPTRAYSDGRRPTFMAKPEHLTPVGVTSNVA